MTTALLIWLAIIALGLMFVRGAAIMRERGDRRAEEQLHGIANVGSED